MSVSAEVFFAKTNEVMIIMPNVNKNIFFIVSMSNMFLRRNSLSYKALQRILPIDTHFAQPVA